MRHAFLILAHERPEMLAELIRALDHPDCDIFMHIDAKAPFDSSALPHTEISRLHVLPPCIDARWGDFSLVEAEFELFEAAMMHCNYDYLHLISGVDYPVNGVDHILDFCKANRGKEFIGFAQNVGKAEISWRSDRRFLFNREFKDASFIKRILRKIWAHMQNIPGLQHKIDAEVKKGSQWCSVTGEFAEYVLENREWLRKNFRGTYCPDEMIMQTLCHNSRFRGHIFCTGDEFRGAMRYIPWENGSLRPLTPQDIPAIRRSEAFFARKFTSALVHSLHSPNSSLSSNHCNH